MFHENRKGRVTYFNMLPYVRFRVDNTHVGLLCTTVHEHPVVLVQECMSCVVLKAHVRDKRHKVWENSSRVIAGLWLHFLRKEW